MNNSVLGLRSDPVASDQQRSLMDTDASPQMHRVLGRALLCVALPLLAGGCGTDWKPDVLAHGEDSKALSVMAKGRDAYARYCVNCHGDKGDGKGPGARFLDPKPRDFSTCRVKFMTVPAGEMPREEDILRTITNGLSGTAMPSFRFVSLEERKALVKYLTTFCPDWAQKSRPAPVNVGEDLFADNPEQAFKIGERIYHAYGRCWSCHPAYIEKPEITEYLASFDMPATSFRDDLYVSQLKDSDWGEKILPPDFLKHQIKTGLDVNHIATVIAAGVSGTAMPTWAGGLTPEQLWGTAHYIRALALMRGSPAAKAMMKRLNAQPAYVPPEPEPAADDSEKAPQGKEKTP